MEYGKLILLYFRF